MNKPEENAVMVTIMPDGTIAPGPMTTVTQDPETGEKVYSVDVRYAEHDARAIAAMIYSPGDVIHGFVVTRSEIGAGLSHEFDAIAGVFTEAEKDLGNGRKARMFKTVARGARRVVNASVYSGLCDRSEWDRGPWDQEPDAEAWVDQHGQAFFIRRNTELGTWCGYVGIAPGHPASRDKEIICALEVHGGVTYQGPSEIFSSQGFDVPPGLQWLGFDCFHGFDGSPLAILSLSRKVGEDFGGGYRTRDYVASECEQLASQLASIAKKGENHGND